ncbi:MAG: ribonuclease P protein component [Faecalibacterium prausnitzii]
MRYRPIRRNSEFGRVYARGKSYVNPGLVMYVLKTRSKKTRVNRLPPKTATPCSVTAPAA